MSFKNLTGYFMSTKDCMKGLTDLKETRKRVYKYFDLPAKDWRLRDCFALTFKAAPLGVSTIIFLRILSAFTTSLQIFTTASFVDTAIAILSGSMAKNAIFLPLFGMFAIAVFPQLVWTIYFYVDNCTRPKVSYVIDEAFLRKRASLKYEHIENSATHDLVGRAAGNSGGTMYDRTMHISWAGEVIIELTTIVGVIFTQVWWSGIVALIVMIPSIFLSVKNGKESYKAFSDTEKLDRRGNVYHDMLRRKDYLEERSTFMYSSYAISRWHEHKKKSDEINLRTAVRSGVRDNVMWILGWLMGLAIILSLVPAVVSGKLSSGMFVGITNATLSFVYILVGNTSSIVRWYVQATKNLKDQSEFTKLSEIEGALDLPVQCNDFESIEFRNVTFHYPGTERDILKNCSFTMKAGEHYAFVGVNGAGKTTVTKLLMGLYDNYDGEIFLNGKELRDYSLAEKKGFFSVVYQDFAKYQIEFEKNIKLGDVNKDDDKRMMDAVRDINLTGVLEGLHSGKDTPLGKISENGVDLSGGEWQRIAISRSLYSDAPMKILDEPTAALDPIAESGIYEMFREVTKGHSAIFITHRLGAARIADKIIVLDGGSVAEFGSHAELLSLGGIYAEMFNTQKGWYED